MSKTDPWFLNPDWHTLWLAVITAWLFYRQYREMRLDPRPWVQIKPSTQVAAPQNGNFWSVPIQFVNVGKSPAKHVLAYMFMEVVDIDRTPHLPRPYEDDKGTYTFVTTGVMYPSVSVDVAANLMKATSETTGESRQLTDTEYHKLMLGQAYLAVYAIACYRDAFNTKHWTTACGFSYFKTAQTSVPSACVAYNVVDDNWVFG